MAFLDRFFDNNEVFIMNLSVTTDDLLKRCLGACDHSHMLVVLEHLLEKLHMVVAHVDLKIEVISASRAQDDGEVLCEFLLLLPIDASLGVISHINR